MSFWIDDPTILLNSKYIFDVLPNEHQSNTQNLNSLSRFIICIIFFLYIKKKKKNYFDIRICYIRNDCYISFLQRGICRI